MSFDHLGLNKDDKVRQIIQKNSDGIYDEIIMYSNIVTKINRKSKSQQRVLAITDKAIYNFTPGSAKGRTFSIRGLFDNGVPTDFYPSNDSNAASPKHKPNASRHEHSKTLGANLSGSIGVAQLKRRIHLKEVHLISVSAIVNEVVLHVPHEWDYLYRVNDKRDVEQIVTTIQEYAAKLTPSHCIEIWSFELNNLSEISENNKARTKKDETQSQYMQRKVSEWQKKYKMKPYEAKKNMATRHIKANSNMFNNQDINHQIHHKLDKAAGGLSPTPQQHRSYYQNYQQRPLTTSFVPHHQQNANVRPVKHSALQQHVSPPVNGNANGMSSFPDTQHHNNPAPQGVTFQFPPDANMPAPNGMHNNHNNLNAINGAPPNMNDPKQFAMAMRQYQQQQYGSNMSLGTMVYNDNASVQSGSSVSLATSQYTAASQQFGPPMAYNNSAPPLHQQRQQQRGGNQEPGAMSPSTTMVSVSASNKTRKKRKRKKKTTFVEKETSEASETRSSAESSSRSDSGSSEYSSSGSGSDSGSASDADQNGDDGPLKLRSSKTKLTPKANDVQNHGHQFPDTAFAQNGNHMYNNNGNHNMNMNVNMAPIQNQNQMNVANPNHMNMNGNMNMNMNAHNHGYPMNSNMPPPGNMNMSQSVPNGQKRQNGHHQRTHTRNKRVPQKALPAMPNRPLPSNHANNNNNANSIKYKIRPKSSNNVKYSNGNSQGHRAHHGHHHHHHKQQQQRPMQVNQNMNPNANQGQHLNAQHRHFKSKSNNMYDRSMNQNMSHNRNHSHNMRPPNNGAPPTANQLQNIQCVSSILEAKQLPVENKEAYLPDNLFWEVFKMTKQQFYAQRPWKIKKMKRDTGFW